MKLIVYTDGASRGNPGPSSYGFFIKDENGKILHKESKYIGINTNNFAEYSAVLHALKYVDKNYKKYNLEVNFLMDSKLVAEQLSGRYKLKSPNLKSLNLSIKKLEKDFKKIIYQHISRTTNRQADHLANLALDNR